PIDVSRPLPPQLVAGQTPARLKLDRTPVDKDVRHTTVAIEQIATHHSQIRNLPSLNRAELILDAEDLRGPDRECAHGIRRLKSVLDHVPHVHEKIRDIC